jgi:hypothetical protein
MLFPMLTDEWLHLFLYFSSEYHNSGQNIIIQFWKNLVDIRSEVNKVSNLFLEYIIVCGAATTVVCSYVSSLYS